MGWVQVTEPFAAAPKLPAFAATHVAFEPVDPDRGFVELAGLAAVGELALNDCDELVVADSSFTSASFASDDEMSIEARRCTFDKCDLSLLRFEDFRQCRVRSAKLAGTDFAGAEIRDVVFENCALRYTNLRSTKLERVTFLDCDLMEADLFEAELIDVDFSGSSLRKVNIDRMKATAVDLRHAKELSFGAIGSLEGCLVDESQLYALAYDLAFAVGLGIETREE